MIFLPFQQCHQNVSEVSARLATQSQLVEVIYWMILWKLVSAGVVKYRRAFIEFLGYYLNIVKSGVYIIVLIVIKKSLLSWNLYLATFSVIWSRPTTSHDMTTSQSVQKVIFLQSVRLIGLDGPDGLLTILAGTLLGWTGSLSESSFDPEDEFAALPSKIATLNKRYLLKQLSKRCLFVHCYKRTHDLAGTESL